MNTNEFLSKFADQFEDSEKPQVTVETKFKELPTWDSMTAMCVQAMILDDYGVTLPDESLRKMTTVQDVVDFVTSEAK